MASELVGGLMLLVMIVLTMLRVPIFLSLAIPGILGTLYLKNWNVVISALTVNIWDASFQYTLSTLPMFIFMGAMLHAAGITGELFTAFKAWLGRLKGGLGYATIGASTLFAAASGSSIANTGTIGLMASQEMLKAGYSKMLTSGSIVAGGTLGILIPPSTFLIVYGMLADESIGALLLAGILPGIILALSYVMTVYLAVTLSKKMAPPATSSAWREKLAALKSTGAIIFIFAVVIGGMFFGFFGPTEAAGMGAVSAVAVTVAKKKFTWKTFMEAVRNTALTCGYMFAIILAAYIYKYVIVLSKFPVWITTEIAELNVSKLALFSLIVLMYVILGAFMDAMAMVMVTVPVVVPVIESLGFDLIWFGIVLCLLVEMALISPPQGMNGFVLNSVAPELGLKEIWKGSLLFMIPIFFVVVLLYLFPQIAMVLPNLMMTR